MPCSLVEAGLFCPLCCEPEDEPQGRDRTMARPAKQPKSEVNREAHAPVGRED